MSTEQHKLDLEYALKSINDVNWTTRITPHLLIPVSDPNVTGQALRDLGYDVW